MTGQFRDAAARFSAEVEGAVTRARRAAGEARARATQFRRDNEELTEQAKSGSLRDVYRDEAEPTSEKLRTDAAEFRVARGLPVEDLPAAGDLLAGLPHRPEPVALEDDDEDFSQHQIMNDVDDHPVAERDRESDTTQSSDEPGVPSQQRIPMRGDADVFREDGLPAILDDLAPPGNPS